MKIEHLLSALTIASIILITGCKNDDFAEIIGVCPVVESTNPINNAINVPLDKVITATFNEKMNPATITAASFTVQGTAPITGVVTYSGTTATFTPSSALTANTTYTAKITTLAKDLMGNAIQKDYAWTFSTGAILTPMVIATDPANLAMDVVLNKVVTATFNIPMDPVTITATTFTLKQGTNVIAGTITYSGTIATFTPLATLTANTVYTGTITTGVKDVAGTSLAADYVWTFTTGSLIAPTVISTDPANNTTNILLNKVVGATFSVAMDPLSVTSSSFTVKHGTTAISGTVAYSGTTATFTPTIPLMVNTLYTGTITTGAKNAAGIPLADDYVWSFITIAAMPPTVTATNPINNATNVELNKVVGATFSVTMDPLTITSSSFTIKHGTTAVSGTIAYSGTTATFTPTIPLTANTLYTGTITTAAKNAAGTPLANDYVWSFTTIAAIPPTVTATDPINNATNVALNKIITANFSVPMDPLTLTAATVTIKQGTTSVAGTLSYSGSTVTFTPSTYLLSDATYTGTITTGAKNVAGTPLVNNYVWTFSTVPHLGPMSPDLKTADRFGILAGVGISNNAGPSVINNLDVGISPGALSSVTGFPPATIVGGAIYTADAGGATTAMLIQTKQDLTDAYNSAAAATVPAPAIAPADLGGKTLAPGIYYSSSTMLLQNGDLTLDGQGDVNAVWIFKVGAAFTSVGGAGGNVILAGGAQAKNIYWQVSSSATIGDYTTFYGNILSFSSITMGSHSVATGRMLARNAAVTLISTNIINKP